MSLQTNTTSSYALDHSLNLLVDTYNYNHWVYSLLRPHLGSEICEIGAGIGNMTRFFLSCDQLVCIEPEINYYNILSNLSSVHLNMKLFNLDLKGYYSQFSASKNFDSIVCINVLEHIKDDFEALHIMSNMLKNGGNILLFVPACVCAYGTLDRSFGHYRRYSKNRLTEIAQENNLAIVRCQYVNFIGAFAWFWYSRIRKILTLDSKSARFFDRFVPFIAATEQLFIPPAGQSLFIVLKKE